MTVLQIVPQLPGSFDGVGDYALILARRLRQDYQIDSIFAAAKPNSGPATTEFRIAPDLDSIADSGAIFEHVILHYANYGYQKRGVPFRLVSILRKLGKNRRGRLLTVFHELFASGSPWKSAFWLRPMQEQIARSIAQISHGCIVSSERVLAELNNLAPAARANVHPVPSNFGEPSLSPDQIASRDLGVWLICGGTALLERSVRSLRAIIHRIPNSLYPRTLFVLGGDENPAVRSDLVDLAIQFQYRPRIGAAEASQIFSTCSFAWLDYFHRPDVQTSVILKSGVFAAACAHAVIPIFPHRGSAISIKGDSLPGPFFIDETVSSLPTADDRVRIATGFYDWYQRHASSQHLVRGVADALGLMAVAT
jgi:hypothetical protein